MMTNKNNAAHGFTLVEMAIVILILGLIVGSVFSFLDIKQEEKLQQDTRSQQKNIGQALGAFALINGRLPCPGRPDAPAATFGYPNGWTAAAPGGTCTSDALRNGILPFRVLGLTRDDALDAYNRPYTYAVSMQAARQQTPIVPTTVHANCRTDPWELVTGTTLFSVPNAWTNKNTPKANFCCQPVPLPTDQMNVYSSTNKISANLLLDAHDVSANYASPDTRVASGVTANLGYVAYALISHGSNGFGAYVFDNAARRDLGTAGTGERENADDNKDYMDLPRTTGTGVGNTGTFDDIVMWRSQQATIRDAGGTSCIIP